ncbi:type I restriction enzyme, S subunit [Flavobacterium gillisiae]|uniref:Type I restriction enzyme, S subunit n=1 Tax=Flavobacterium gillisiae TaxID=150146 RepID=A0A1H4FYQ2_9FLAO|nr:restriction endonuclease subunit S [Flavobacterium gillisiae]SEB02414.1 type I restriction enzyme, S subunit [Flavobacterium gillisiae]
MSTVAQLIGRKKTEIPQLRFPEFTSEWEEKKLGNLLEFKNGINATKEQYGRGVKFINVLDILNNDFITHEKIIGSVDVEEDIANKFSVNYGDILFQRSSETREEVGTASVYLDKEVPATFGGFVIRGKKIGEYDPVFLNKLLKTDISRDAITSKSGGSTRYNIGQETLNSIFLPFPTLPEQTKIASFLTAVDEKLTALKKKKTLLEQYKKGVMQQIFAQELRFRDDKGNDYADWEEKKLGEVAKKKSSNISANKIEENIGDYIIYGASGILKKVDFYKEEDDYISIVKDGAGVGRLLYCKGKSSVLGTMEIISPKSELNTYFLYCLLSNIDFVKYVTGSTIPHIYFKDYSTEYCGIPSLKEQTKIANFLSAIDIKINHCQAQIEKATIWKKGLLQQMFA